MKEWKGKSKLKIFTRLWIFLKPYWFWFIARITSTIGKAVIDMLVAYVVLLLVNSAVKGDVHQLWQSIYFMVGLVGVGTIVYFIETYSSGRFSSQVVRDMREKLVTRIEQLPIAFFENHHSGELISKMSNDVNILEDFLGGGFFNIIFHSIRFTGSFIFALLISWRLVFFCMVVVPVTIFLSNIISRPLENYYETLYKDLGKVNSIVQDSIGGIYLIKSYNLKEVLYDKYKVQVDNNLTNALKIEKRMAINSSLSVVVQLIPFALCFLYGGYFVVTNKLSLAEFMAFATMLSNIVQSASTIPSLISNYRGNIGIMKHLFEILDYNMERTSGDEYAIDKSVAAIEFEEVTFAYKGERKILNNLSFIVENGKTTALVGTSGCGKTTILKLICGFYEAEGSIKLYGKNLKDWNLAAVRENISLVSQDPYLFPGNIAENIGYGRLGADIEEIIIASKAANAHEFIMELPEGYNTVLGERGITLSGGQKQRISIARAILKNAKILLLDEPTSALDISSEFKVQKALQGLMQGRTVFIISHRLSTIKDADKILLLDEGCIKESGSHEELIRESDLYRKLNTAQITVLSSMGIHLENMGV
ncbi:ATP-binding cassette, subfamily B, MsbA [Hathewaya proteolytica DSM 3090]|uniref:ATP-binding cassette, subfamily B, MsbA n=1 Tax=Hathewaya proteolytica DSM 3090 TaxID=1121331 RepID=A0A1M6MVZ2_9CLOT|nr:ABC transporter ATP-binding protein [Hathewaya proteolytica]SHJ87675.1 ATP-binding cassette, subfamily B, MsbA [Hathewaya proteolytica DSM 3090]